MKKLKKKTGKVISLIIALAMVMTLFAGVSFAATTSTPTETDDGLYTLREWLGSWTSGGTEDKTFTATAFVISGTVYTSDSTITATSATNTTIEDSESGHNGIVIVDTDYTVSNASIKMLTDADGSDTCDFSGVGTAIAVYGDSVVTIEDSYIETSGVATMPVFADDGATVTIKSSTLISRGGTLYESYMNSPDQAVMVAPPWILGIMGTSRTTNLMGTDSTMNVIDSETSSGAWAVLSTDSGSNMYLNVYNTSLTLLNGDESEAAPLQEDGGEIETVDNPYTTTYGSGYGTYAIGDAVEVFAGATINVGTYATIYTGGSGVYTSLTAGETYTLESADGENDITYTATEDAVTVINSDTFGFMVHQDSNTITIEEGTVINTGYATFLIKSGGGGSVTATIDDAVITNGGVLIQVMDNDDTTNGGMMETDDELNTNGGSQNFIPYHTENTGFNTENTSSSSANTQSFTFTNGEYTGNIYNASGSDNSDNGPLSATTLNVTIGEGATLSGAVASTSFIHVTYEGSEYVKNTMNGYAFDDEEEAAAFAEEYQNTYFTISEYYSIGQVANLVNYGGKNNINLTLTDDAVWYVTGTSLVTSVTIEDDAYVVVEEGATLTIGSVTLSAGTYYADTFDSIDTTSTYEIEVESEVEIAVGETYQLNPSLTVVESEDTDDDTSSGDDSGSGDGGSGDMGDMGDGDGMGDGGSGGGAGGNGLSYATSTDDDGNTVITLSNSDSNNQYTYELTLGDGLTLVDGSTSGTLSSDDITITVSGSGEAVLTYTAMFGPNADTESEETITIGGTSASSVSAGASTVLANAVALDTSFSAYVDYLTDQFIPTYCGSDEDLIAQAQTLTEETYADSEFYIYITSDEGGAGEDYGVYAYTFEEFQGEGGYNYTYSHASEVYTGITFSYSSADSQIASVDEDGVITGVAAGETTITVAAYYEGLQVATADVAVTVTGGAEEGDDTEDGSGDTDDSETPPDIPSEPGEGEGDTDDGSGDTDDGSGDTDDGTGDTDDGSGDTEDGSGDTEDGSGDTGDSETPPDIPSEPDDDSGDTEDGGDTGEEGGDTGEEDGDTGDTGDGDTGDTGDSNTGDSDTGDAGEDSLSTLMAEAQTLISDYGSLSASSSAYTTDSWTAYQEAVAYLQKLLESGTATEADIQAAIAAVEQAKAALVEAGSSGGSTTNDEENGATTATSSSTETDETEETTTSSSTSSDGDTATGDSNNVALWMSLGALAILGLAFAGLKRRFN